MNVPVRPPLNLEVQIACEARCCLPSEQDLFRFASMALKRERAEVVVRVVDEAESAELNGQYRQKQGSTNVLSFPFEAPPGFETDHLGDLVVCAPVVEREAQEQGKALEAHWAHLVIHGMLHLQGYDHIDERDAAVMEAEEIALMRDLGYPNPYEETAKQP